MTEPLLKLVVVGHVDHGKSTLVGRLLHDTGSLADGRIEELRAASAQRKVAFEWSFALDAMQAERDQAVTIETTRVWLRLPGRDTLLIDAPGHREFLAKMITGAAVADAALLIVDVMEGIQDQTLRHAHLLALLGIAQIVVAVNKMDLAGFDETRFKQRRDEVTASLKKIGLAPVAIVPVAARDGDNLVQSSPRMSWYKRLPLTAVIAALPVAAAPVDQPLRFPIQDVYRIDQRRLYVGRIESGRLKLGDEILFSPSNKLAQVRSIEIGAANLTEATAGRSIGITLIWLGNQKLSLGENYRMQLGTMETAATVESVNRIVDTGIPTSGTGATLERDAIGDVTLHSSRLLALDDSSRLPRSARFVLRHRNEVVAGGLVRLAGIPDLRPITAATALAPVAHRVTRELRAQRFGHRGGVLWFTGLSGAGKSTLAMAVEEHLFRKGYAVYVLDGDNVRGGLNSDLSFSAKDRAENVRRVGELAALFADAGFICITAFISPYMADRARARAAAGAAFHEIYISADLATCERRDTKGLYRKARSGELREFTGISSEYEPPDAPDLAIDTQNQPVEACAELIVGYIESNFAARDLGR
jgi:bifunctional enzyme CysN/CysC